MVVRANLYGPVGGVFDQHGVRAAVRIERVAALVGDDFARDHGLFAATEYQGRNGDGGQHAPDIGGVPMAAFHAMALVGPGAGVQGKRGQGGGGFYPVALQDV
jgi:hypothetical protein